MSTSFGRQLTASLEAIIIMTAKEASTTPKLPKAPLRDSPSSNRASKPLQEPRTSQPPRDQALRDCSCIRPVSFLYVLSRQSTDVAGNQTPPNAGLVTTVAAQQGTHKRRRSNKNKLVHPSRPSYQPTHNHTDRPYETELRLYSQQAPAPHSSHLTSCILHTAACLCVLLSAFHISGCPHPSSE